MTGRRIVSIFLPHFAMERWEKTERQKGNAPPDEVPLVLAVEGRHGPVIHGVNRAAQEAGMTSGARVVDMRALCPDLQVVYGNPEGDAAALDRLALWAQRWCPWSRTDGANGLILDTTGSDHLMGGEAAMLRRMEADLASLGVSAQLAVAPTWGAAWALARFGPVRATCPEEDLTEAVAPLPVASLRLGDETVLLLHRLGLKRIGDLARIPRLSLTRRFARASAADNPLIRLDQMMGKLAEPVSGVSALPPVRAIRRLAEPILDPTPYVADLCRDICTDLDRLGQGCRGVRLSVFHTDGQVARVSAATSHPSREPAHLAGLFADKLERIDPGFGFDLILLEADGLEELQEAQVRLDGAAEDALNLAHLIDRLSSRLGAKAITRPAPRESHLPERAQAWVSAMDEMPETPAPPPQDRPLRLLDTPEEIRVLYAVPEGPPAQFIWRRQTLQVARYAGPERIAPEWWRDKPGTRLRDYFKIEDQTGRRFWLYREGLLEDGRGAAPRWFLHGMFA